MKSTLKYQINIGEKKNVIIKKIYTEVFRIFLSEVCMAISTYIIFFERVLSIGWCVMSVYFMSDIIMEDKNCENITLLLHKKKKKTS